MDKIESVNEKEDPIPTPGFLALSCIAMKVIFIGVHRSAQSGPKIFIMKTLRTEVSPGAR